MTRPAVLDDTSEWIADAVNMIRAYAASGLSFTAEDIRRSMRTPPHDNNMGAAFRTARTLGLITTVGYKESSEPSRKGGLIRVWSKS